MHGIRNRAQYRIADMMPEPVVDPLEVVQIDQHQGQWLTIALRAGQQRCDHLLEGSPVVQARERVEPRHLLRQQQALLGSPVLLGQTEAEQDGIDGDTQLHRVEGDRPIGKPVDRLAGTHHGADHRRHRGGDQVDRLVHPAAPAHQCKRQNRRGHQYGEQDGATDRQRRHVQQEQNQLYRPEQADKRRDDAKQAGAVTPQLQKGRRKSHPGSRIQANGHRVAPLPPGLAGGPKPPEEMAGVDRVHGQEGGQEGDVIEIAAQAERAYSARL